MKGGKWIGGEGMWGRTSREGGREGGKEGGRERDVPSPDTSLPHSGS